MNNSTRAIVGSLFELSEELTWVATDLLNFPAQLAAFLSSITRGGTIRTETSSFFSGSLISEEASIGHFSLIRNSIIQEGVRIGAHVEIANSVVMADAVIPHHNYIGYSIIGRGVRLGGNTRTAVRRLDGRLPHVELPEIGVCHSIHQKIGAFIGDRSRIGSSVVLMPLTILGKNCLIDPGLIVSGYHVQGSRIRNPNIIRPSGEETQT